MGVAALSRAAGTSETRPADRMNSATQRDIASAAKLIGEADALVVTAGAGRAEGRISRCLTTGPSNTQLLRTRGPLQLIEEDAGRRLTHLRCEGVTYGALTTHAASSRLGSCPPLIKVLRCSP